MLLVWVGITCEIAATMLGTLGKQLVSYSGKLEDDRSACLFKIAGLTVTSVFGPILDASAYALAPQSLVAPLNGLDIVWNTSLAPFTLGERLTRSYALGSILVFLGAVLSSFFGQHHNSKITLERERELFLSWRFLLYALASALVMLGSALVLRRRPRGVGDWQRGIALGGAAGFVAGNMFFLSEALGMLRESLKTGQWAAWRHPLPYGVTLGAVAVAISNVPLMATALEEYDALFMITLFAGCQITTACISAQLVLREMSEAAVGRVLGYWACIGLMVLGLVVVGRQARRLAPGRPAPGSAAGSAAASAASAASAAAASAAAASAAAASAPAPAAAGAGRAAGVWERPKAVAESAVLWAGWGSGVGYAGLEGGEDGEELLEACGRQGLEDETSSSSSSACESDGEG